MAEQTDTNTSTDSAITLLLAGPSEWRSAATDRLVVDNEFVILADIEADVNVVEVATLPLAEVLVMTLDATFASPGIKLALALQHRMPGIAIVAEIPTMFRDELEQLESYRRTWTLIASDTAGDQVTFRDAVRSASRGLPWVDPTMSRRLDGVRAVVTHRTAPVPGFEN